LNINDHLTRTEKTLAWGGTGGLLAEAVEYLG
jgi:hypothetical protein